MAGESDGGMRPAGGVQRQKRNLVTDPGKYIILILCLKSQYIQLENEV